MSSSVQSIRDLFLDVKRSLSLACFFQAKSTFGEVCTIPVRSVSEGLSSREHQGSLDLCLFSNTCIPVSNSAH